MGTCALCYREKDATGLAQPLPEFPQRICFACSREVNRVLGFLKFYGFSVTPLMPQSTQVADRQDGSTASTEVSSRKPPRKPVEA